MLALLGTNLPQEYLVKPFYGDVLRLYWALKTFTFFVNQSLRETPLQTKYIAESYAGGTFATRWPNWRRPKLPPMTRFGCVYTPDCLASQVTGGTVLRTVKESVWKRSIFCVSHAGRTKGGVRVKFPKEQNETKERETNAAKKTVQESKIFKFNSEWRRRGGNTDVKEGDTIKFVPRSSPSVLSKKKK